MVKLISILHLHVYHVKLPKYLFRPKCLHFSKITVCFVALFFLATLVKHIVSDLSFLRMVTVLYFRVDYAQNIVHSEEKFEVSFFGILCLWGIRFCGLVHVNEGFIPLLKIVCTFFPYILGVLLIAKSLKYQTYLVF